MESVNRLPVRLQKPKKVGNDKRQIHHANVRPCTITQNQTRQAPCACDYWVFTNVKRCRPCSIVGRRKAESQDTPSNKSTVRYLPCGNEKHRVIYQVTQGLDLIIADSIAMMPRDRKRMPVEGRWQVGSMNDLPLSLLRGSLKKRASSASLTFLKPV